MPEIKSLIVFISVLFLLFIVFKIFHWSLKTFFKLLLNALMGAVILVVFDFVFAGLLHWKFFDIPITWITALATGILGVPGVIILLILKLLLPGLL